MSGWTGADAGAQTPPADPTEAAASAASGAPGTDAQIQTRDAPPWAFPEEFERTYRGKGFAGSLAIGARSRLVNALSRAPCSAMIGDGPRIAAGLSAALIEEIEILVFRTVTLEERIAGLEDSPGVRSMSSFDVRLRRPGASRRLFETYPGLLRHLHLRCDRWLAACLEMVDRLRSDRPAISRVFGIALDDCVVDAAMAHGDAHLGGRRVVIVRFASGARLVYKPRPVEAAKRFQDLLALLNERGLDPPLRTVAVLACDGYGWMEHVAGRSCRTDAGLVRYFRRAGALIAALHAAGATDCHFENVLADGEHPVVVDLETLMRPGFRSAPDTATGLAEEEIAESVVAVGMLPSIDGADLGALAVEPDQATQLTTIGLVDAGTPNVRVERMPWRLGDVPSLPLRRGRRVGPADHVREVEHGFVDAYRLIEAARDVLLAPKGILASLGRAHVRVVLRPTAYYAEILTGCSHPVALHDAAATDRLTSRLRSPADALRAAAAAEELEHLMLADVPYFGLRADTRVLCFGAHEAPSSITLPSSGFESARARLSGMGRSDLARQRGLLLATLGVEPAPQRTYADPEEPLQSASRVGDALLSGAVRHGETAAWLHVLEPQGTMPKRIVPTGPWLYDGLLGIAFFLAQLAKATGDCRYQVGAAAALREAHRQIAAEVRSAPGVFEGVGGVIYALPHLSLLLDDESLVQEAERAAEAVIPLVGQRSIGGDLTSGSAGLTLAGLSLHSVRPSETSRRLLDACGAHLVGMVDGSCDAGLPFARGASHGWSGVLLALARLQAARPASDLADALSRVVAHETDLTVGDRWTDPRDADHEGQATWCHGVPGIALCRISAATACRVAGLDEAVDAAVLALRETQRTALPPLGLCHGAPGVFEASLAASRSRSPSWRDPPGDGVAPLVSGQAFSDVEIFRPGLMTGLAGLGHAWLLMHDPTTAGVLTLDAPSRD